MNRYVARNASTGLFYGKENTSQSLAAGFYYQLHHFNTKILDSAEAAVLRATYDNVCIVPIEHGPGGCARPIWPYIA